MFGKFYTYTVFLMLCCMMDIANSDSNPYHQQSLPASPPMLNDQKFIKVPLQLGLKGFVYGVVNSESMERAFVEVIKDEDGTRLTSTTFEGQGKGIPMNTPDNKPDWSFDPLDHSLKLTIHITIYHLDGNDRQTPSKMVGPLYINKQPEPGYPMELHSSTVISEHHDGDVVSYDKCTISVIQYKD